MTSSQGTEYYLKSMNGIKVFDDGSGTVIEDDSITVNTIDCAIINTDEFNTDTFNINTLSTNTISSTTGATGTIQLIGDVQATKIKSEN